MRIAVQKLVQISVHSPVHESSPESSPESRVHVLHQPLRAWYIVAAVLEHVKLIVAAASTRGNTVPTIIGL